MGFFDSLFDDDDDKKKKRKKKKKQEEEGGLLDDLLADDDEERESGKKHKKDDGKGFFSSICNGLYSSPFVSRRSEISPKRLRTFTLSQTSGRLESCRE